MSETEVTEPRYDRCPAKVLGALRRGEITVILFPAIGLVDGGIFTELPVQMIPLDLRMPNSEFDVLFDRVSRQFVEVLLLGKIDVNPD